MRPIPMWAPGCVALLVAGTACGGGNGTDPDDGGNPPPPEFAVTAVTPANGTTSGPWPSVTIVLSAPVDPASLTSVTMRLLDGLTALPARTTVAHDGRSVTLEAPLLPGKLYRMEATAGVMSATGIALAALQTTFNTRALQGVPTQQGQFIRQALVQDGSGRLHLMTHDADAGLIYSTCTSACSTAAGWQATALGTTPDFMLDIGLAVDGNGGVHATYHQAEGLRYATCSSNCSVAGNWQMLTLDADEKAGMWSRIKIDETGTLHLVQSNWTDGLLRYHRCADTCGSETSWSSVELPDPIVDMQDLSLAVRDSRVHVVARGQGASYTRQYLTCTTACLNTGGWTAGLINPTGLPALGGALTVGSGGELIHAYIDEPNRLVVATCTSGCSLGSAWSSFVLDAAGNSVLVDIANWGDRIAVAYGANNELRLATCLQSCGAAANWKTGALNSSGGPAPSLILDPEGQPRVSSGQAGGRYLE